MHVVELQDCGLKSSFFNEATIKLIIPSPFKELRLMLPDDVLLAIDLTDEVYYYIVESIEITKAYNVNPKTWSNSLGWKNLYEFEQDTGSNTSNVLIVNAISCWKDINDLMRIKKNKKFKGKKV